MSFVFSADDDGQTQVRSRGRIFVGSGSTKNSLKKRTGLLKDTTIAMSRVNSEYLRVFTHYEGQEALWLSPGGLEFLRKHVGYQPFEQEIVPQGLVYRLQKLKHIRPLREAPPTGAWADVPVEDGCGCFCGRVK